MVEIVPNPGSKEAQQQGCACPISDNHYGKGMGGNGKEPLFWRDENCPLHGVESSIKREARKRPHE